MNWTRRVGLLCLFILPLSAASVARGQSQVSTPDGGIVVLDDASGSLALSNDGGNYILFQKLVGDGPGFPDGYSRIGVRTRLWEPGDDHIFGELHALITDSGRIGFNAGGGYRAVVDGAVMGIHGWFDDYESGFGNRYRQITTGVEYLAPFFDVRANGYIPASNDSRLLNTFDFSDNPFYVGNNIATAATGRVERILAGWDVEAGGPIPGAMDWLRGYAGAYQLIDDNDSTVGFRARAEARFMEGVNLNLIVSDDDRFGTNVNLGVEVRFRGTMPTRFASGFLADRRYDQVRRVWPVQIGVGNEDVIVNLNRPGTTDPIEIAWVDNTNPDAGDGTFENPFQELPTTADGADLILVNAGIGDTTGNIVLQANQRLLGEGKLHSVNTDQLGIIDLPEPFSSTGPAPTLVALNDAAPIVTLADNTAVRSFEMVGNIGIYGDGVNNFLIDCIHSPDIFRGIDINDASGIGIISNVSLAVADGGRGIRVNSAGDPLLLGLSTVDVTGGNEGIVIESVDGDTELVAEFVTISEAVSTGLLLSATGFSNLDATVNDSVVSNNLGNGVALLVNGSSGTAVFNRLDASNNAGDGVNIQIDVGSIFDVAIDESTIDSNGGENIDLHLSGASDSLLLVEATSLMQAGQNGFEFTVTESSTFDTTFNNVDINGSGNDAINGSILSNGTADLLFANFDASGSVQDGLNLSASSQSTVTGMFTDGTFSDSGSNAVNVLATTTANVDLIFTNVTADNLAASGNVDLSALTGGSIDVNWINGSISNGDANGVLVSAQGAASQVDVAFRTTFIDSHAGDGVNVDASNDSIVNVSILETSVQNNGGDGLDISLNDAVTGDVAIRDSQLAMNGEDGLKFVVDRDSTLAVTATVANSTNDFSDNGSNAFDGTVDNRSSATLLIDGGIADGSGAEGALLSVVDDSQLFFRLRDGSLSMSGEDGMNVLSSESQVGIVLENSVIDQNGQVNAISGNGLTVQSVEDSVFNLSMINSSASMNAGRGLDFTANTGGSIEIGSISSVVDDNAREGMAFSVADGSGFSILSAGDSFSGNGTSGNFSGVLGNVTGTGAVASLSFTDALIDMNSLDGAEFHVSEDATLITEFLSSNVLAAVTSASQNTRNGISLTATGTDTVASVIMEGPTDVSQNGATGLLVDANGISELAVLAQGTFSNNGFVSGGDGINISSVDVATTAVDVSGPNMNAMNNNQGSGVVVNLQNTTTAPVDVTTLTQTVTVNGLALGGANATNNLQSAVEITGDNVTIDNLTVANVIANGNLSTGLGFALTNSTIDTLSMDNVSSSMNLSDGILFDLTGSQVGMLTISNSETSTNLGNGIEVSGDSVTIDTFAMTNVDSESNLGDGIEIILTNATLGTLSMDAVESTFNMFDGLQLDLTDSQVGLLNIVNSVTSSNMGNGTRIDLNNTPVGEMNIVGNEFGILPGQVVDPSTPIDDSLPVIRAGFDLNTLAANDDGSTGLVSLGFDANFFGQMFTDAFVNNNGNITFDAPLGTFTPFGLLNTSAQIIAPFFADVDTSPDSNGNTSGLVMYGTSMVNGRPAFGVNWLDVRHFSTSGTNNGLPTNSFQLVLIDRSDVRAGDFDIEFNYGSILWEAGTASGSDEFGLGGSAARVGFSNGVDTSFELPGSGVNGAFLDSGPAATSLIQNSIVSVNDGRYIFFARDGDVGGGDPDAVGNTGDGLQINIANGSDIGLLTIDQNSVESNGARGISVTASDSIVDTVSVSGNLVNQNNSHGIAFDFDNATLNSVSIDLNEVTENMGDGVLFDFNASTANGTITNNEFSLNDGWGIHFTTPLGVTEMNNTFDMNTLGDTNLIGP